MNTKKPLKSALKKPKPPVQKTIPDSQDGSEITGGKAHNAWVTPLLSKTQQAETVVYTAEEKNVAENSGAKQTTKPMETDRKLPVNKTTNRRDRRAPVEKVQCEVCQIWVSGPINYIAHVEGKVHARNLLLREMGVKITGKVGIGERRAKIIPILKNCTQPITGVQFLCEFQRQNQTAPCRYVCTLCETLMEEHIVIGHLTGKSHRYKYMSQCYPEQASIMATMELKSDKQAYAADKAKEIEELEGGRKLDCIKVSIDFEPFTTERDDPLEKLNTPSQFNPVGPPSLLEENFAPVKSTAELFRDLFEKGIRIMDILPLIETCEINNQEEAAAVLTVSNILSAKLLNFNSQNLSQSISRGGDYGSHGHQGGFDRQQDFGGFDVGFDDGWEDYESGAHGGNQRGNQRGQRRGGGFGKPQRGQRGGRSAKGGQGWPY